MHYYQYSNSKDEVRVTFTFYQSCRPPALALQTTDQLGNKLLGVLLSQLNFMGTHLEEKGKGGIVARVTQF